MMIYNSDLWDRIEELCWEGFDKFRIYAHKHYPNSEKSVNKSMDLMMEDFDGDYEEWCEIIEKITKSGE